MIGGTQRRHGRGRGCSAAECAIAAEVMVSSTMRQLWSAWKKPGGMCDRDGTLHRDEEQVGGLGQGGQRVDGVFQAWFGHADDQHHEVQRKCQGTHQPEGDAQARGAHGLGARVDGAAVAQGPGDGTCGKRGAECVVLGFITKPAGIIDDPARRSFDHQCFQG